jgi:hypothetical protein
LQHVGSIHACIGDLDLYFASGRSGKRARRDAHALWGTAGVVLDIEHGGG